MTPTFETILYDKRDAIAVVTLNRPERHNAINGPMSVELARMWEDVKSDPEVLVVVLTGAGEKSLCTGFDVADMGGATYTIAIRRAQRIGDLTADIEDVGVSSSFQRPLTKRDLLDGNRDLLDYACRLLDTGVQTSLEYALGDAQITVRVDGLSRVQLDVDGSPRLTATPSRSGVVTFAMPPDPMQHRIDLIGYDGEIVRQRRRLHP